MKALSYRMRLPGPLVQAHVLAESAPLQAHAHVQRPFLCFFRFGNLIRSGDFQIYLPPPLRLRLRLRLRLCLRLRLRLRFRLRLRLRS